MSCFRALAPFALFVSVQGASHTISKNAEGVSTFVLSGQSDDSSRSLSQIDSMTQPDAPASGTVGDGPWATVTVGEVPEGCNSLAASIDEQGTIKIQPSLSGSHDALFLQDGATQSIAWGTWRDTLDEVGWSSLSVGLSDDSQTDDGIQDLCCRCY